MSSRIIALALCATTSLLAVCSEAKECDTEVEPVATFQRFMKASPEDRVYFYSHETIAWRLSSILSSSSLEQAEKRINVARFQVSWMEGVEMQPGCELSMRDNEGIITVYGKDKDDSSHRYQLTFQNGEQGWRITRLRIDPQ